MLTKEQIEKKYPGKKLEKIKHLNLWGKDLENIDIISKLKSLKIISLSANKISSLKPFQDLGDLKELYLRNNNISNIDEIDYLKKCNNLKSLWLEDNPIYINNIDEYKKKIIEKLPNLENLDNIPINDIKNGINNNNKDINSHQVETDIVVQETNENKSILEDDSKKEKNENENEIKNNIDKNKTITKKDKSFEDINDLILDNEPINNKENKESKESKENDLKKTKNSLITSNENKLEDLLLSYDKEEKTNDKTNINDETTNNNTNVLESKSDIFKTGFYDLNKNETQNLNKDIINPKIENKENKENNDNLNNENGNPMNISGLKNLNIEKEKEPNNELLNDILRNVDTSQTFLKKYNSNKEITTNLNINNSNTNNNFTKNLNDMVKNVEVNSNLSQSFKIGGNTGINNILKDVQTSQTMVKKNENEINKILGEVNSSQTMNKQKDQEIKNILKDVETTATNFNKSKSEIKNNNNLQSIDDIRKIFNNDYPNNNNINNINNNLYSNNNIKDSRIKNIFKNESISSGSTFYNLSRSKAQDNPIIPKIKQNYDFDSYEYNNNEQNNNQNNEKDSYNSKNGQNNNYNLNPKHMHKINAIINLLEDLNLENLLHVKNLIIKQIESKK